MVVLQDKMTALLFAAIQCKADVVNVLLLAGANVNAQNKVNSIYRHSVILLFIP